MTPAECLARADEAATLATEAQNEMLNRATKLQTGVLTQPPEVIMAQINALNSVTQGKFAEAAYWLRRREAALDEEDEALDAASNGPYERQTVGPDDLVTSVEIGRFPETPDARNDPPTFRLLGSNWGTDGFALRIYAGDRCAAVFNDTELRQAAGESGFLMMLSKLPTAAHSVDDGA